jgi:DNA-directed RNA polymerase specialized sigma subunit
VQDPHYSDRCSDTPYDHGVENPLADIEQVVQIADPAERAREIGRRMALVTQWHTQLKEIRQAAIVEMKASGMSFAEIGRQIGLHRNRVQQILEGR